MSEQQEIDALRSRIFSYRRENEFLRLALGRAIGDGSLVIPLNCEPPPRFIVSASAEHIMISRADAGIFCEGDTGTCSGNSLYI